MHAHIPGIEIERELGRGSSAVVYRARRRGRIVALKVYRAQGDVQARFRQEVAALATLDHPHITRIHEVGSVDGSPYLIREYVEGTTLAARIAQGPMALREVVAVGCAMASALGTAHRRGLIHRDVKPQNILIDPRERPVLSDFGLAIREGSDEALAGTLRYAAPEQSGMLHRPVDARSDLYGLGVVLYEALAGHPPFPAVEPGELARQHAVLPPPSLARIRPELPDPMVRIIEQLLSKDPDDRYQRAEQLLTDLSDVVEGLWIQPIAGPELVGRRTELQRLRSASLACTTGGRVVLITGASGSGKSTLVDALVGDTPHRVIGAKCHEEDPVPFGPIRRALDAWIGEQQRRDTAGAARELQILQQAGQPLASLLVPLSTTLAALFPDVGERHDTDPDRFLEGIAALLVQLSDDRPLILVIDDVQWLDDASREVIARLGGRLSHSHVLLVATARAEVEHQPSVEAFVQALGDAPLERIALAPLPQEEGLRLVRGLLGNRSLPEDLAQVLVQRASGSPLLLREYLRAVLDEGLIKPSWETWVVEPGWQDQLQLPDGMVDAVLGRVRHLDATTRGILSCAAQIGGTFDTRLLARIHDTPIHTALREGVRLELIERTGAERYRFQHDRIHEALLAALDPGEVPALHDRIAGALSEDSRTDSASIYAIATHAAAGRRDDPVWIAHTSLVAGRRALRDHAHADAHAYLSEARRARLESGLPPDLDLEELFARTAALTRRLAESRACLSALLPQITDPLRRARIRVELSRIFLSLLAYEDTGEQLRLALTELREPLPRSRLGRLGWGLLYHVLVVLGLPPLRATGARAERLAILCRLYDVYFQLCVIHNEPDKLLYLATRWHLAARALGPGTELAVSTSTLGMLYGSVRLDTRARAWLDRGIQLTRTLDDPPVLARALYLRGMGSFVLGAPEAEGHLRALLSRHWQWLDTYDHAVSSGLLAKLLLERGYARQALELYHASEEKIRASGGPFEVYHSRYGSCLALLGRPEEALAQLQHADAAAARMPELAHPVQRAFLLEAYVALQLHQQQLGPDLPELLERHRASGRAPSRDVAINRSHYIFQALACLDRALHAEPGQDQARWVQRLDHALRLLDQLSWIPVLRAHHHAIRGGLLALQGHEARALAALQQADLEGIACDCPWARLTAATVRAHLLQRRGDPHNARRDARIALTLADELGLEAAADRLVQDFDLDPGVPRRSLSLQAEQAPSSGLASIHSSDLAAERSKRFASALLTVSLASASSLEPQTQAHNVLIELTRLLGAERALFFQVDPASGSLEQIASTGQGADPVSQTVVAQVLQTRAPLVLTSTDDGAALGSESIVLQGLRSVIAVPLLVREQLVGVVYLDSRLARGVFDEDDVDLLQGMANHIAIAVEMARAARRENQALREGRRVAEAANQAKDQFLANMSHELRTPLNAIIGYSELVDEELADLEAAPLREDLGRVQRAAHHLLRIIDDLLDLTRIGAGHLELRPERVDLHALIPRVLELARPLLRDRSEPITVALDPRARWVCADEDRLQQVITNLLSNAAKFTRQGTITLTSEQGPDQRVVLGVADTGIGIAPEALPHVFEPFHQADGSSTRRHGGAGLGLAICRELVEGMGGTIALTSELGHGTTVQVVLPADPPPPEPGNAPQRPTRSHPTETR